MLAAVISDILKYILKNGRVLLKVGPRKRLERVLFQQHLLILVRHHRSHALKRTLTQRKQVLCLVLVVILALPLIRLAPGVKHAQRGDVNVQPIGGIYPARVDDVVAGPVVAKVCPGIDVQHVVAFVFLVGGDVV